MKTDAERFAKWSNCWGRYKIELDAKHKGDVLEGEWLSGRLHGQGTYKRDIMIGTITWKRNYLLLRNGIYI